MALFVERTGSFRASPARVGMSAGAKRNSFVICRQGFYLNGQIVAPNPVGRLIGPSVAIELNPAFRGRVSELARYLGETLENYRCRGGNVQKYAEEVLPVFLGRSTRTEEVKEWERLTRQTLLDFNQAFLHKLLRFLDSFTGVLMSFRSIEEIKDNKFLILQLFFGREKLPDGSYGADIMLDFIEGAESLADLQEVKEPIRDAAGIFDDPDVYLDYFINNVLLQVKSPAELEKGRKMILDFMRRFGDPLAYIEKILPPLMGKVDPARWEEWDGEIKAAVADYCRENEARPMVAVVMLAGLIEKGCSVAELKQIKITPEMVDNVVHYMMDCAAKGFNLGSKGNEGKF
jgi:hypothetical protein